MDDQDEKAAEARRAANDRRVADDIRQYGAHVISVLDPEQLQPSFSYSVGIFATTGAPEVLVVGLRPELGHFMVNEYKDQVRAGLKPQRGQLYEGFLEGFAVYLEPARPSLHARYTLGCERYYRRKDGRYPVLQIVWPSTSGVWPWQKGASDWFKAHQPMLGRKRPDRP